jgi:tRNA 2-thiocytidine biosynthesis protein TtcA
MIMDGDRICVGISGGKDSLTLFWFLYERLSRIPISYTLFPCYIDPGFEDSFADPLRAFFDQNGWTLRVEQTDCGVVAHSDANRENPCFLCSRMRRKRLFEVAAELGCNKLALGHHKDDIIESLFISMCYAGEISLMKPFLPMFHGAVTLIRPLAFADEQDIKRFAARMAFPEFKNPCPSAATSKRSEIKALLEGLYRGNRKVKGNLFRSLDNVKTDYLL